MPNILKNHLYKNYKLYGKQVIVSKRIYGFSFKRANDLLADLKKNKSRSPYYQNQMKFFSTSNPNEKIHEKENKEQSTEQTEEQTNQEEPNQEGTKANYKTSRKIRIYLGKAFKYLFFIGSLVTLWNFYLYLYKNNPKAEFGYFGPSISLINKIYYLWFITYGTLTLPYYEKVIPDALEVVNQPSKKTLVLNLNKTLINYEYKFGSGFEILKRPGLLRFIQEMGQFYEIVVFGTEDSTFVEEVISKIDQFDINIKYKLGKEAIRLVNRRYVKDLNFLNRDLRNVICIDYDPDNVLFHQENLIIIPEFLGDGKDRELLQLIVFLKEMAKPEIKDVRKELEKYGNFKPHINFYKSNPKYKRLLPKEQNITDDEDLQAVKLKK
jgi:hypothetical protein